MSEQRENSGNLFRIPAESRKADSWPEYEGEFSTTCPHCNQSTRGWVKAWVKDGKLGKFFSLAFKHKQKVN